MVEELTIPASSTRARFSGTMYEAANWSYVGNSKGYARSNGHYTDPHGKPKRMYVRALRDDAREILRQRGELADCWQARVPAAVGDEVDKRSLELRGQQQGLCAQQRSLHRPARQAQADVRTRVARRRARDPAAAWRVGRLLAGAGAGGGRRRS